MGFFGTIVSLFETFVPNYPKYRRILRFRKSDSEKYENILGKGLKIGKRRGKTFNADKSLLE
jgi:hypothetical protein